MLVKLMKYDLKWTYKLLVIFYSLTLAFSLLARACFTVENSLLFSVLTAILRGCAVSMMVNCIINAIMRSWVRFKRNIYGDESYLTHTLPVPRDTVYLSKLLSAVVSVLASVVLTVGCVLLCYYSESMVEFLRSSFRFVASAYDTSVASLILSLSAVLFFQMVFILLAGYVGIIIGHRGAGAKTAMSVVWGFVIYLAGAAVLLGTVFLIGTANSEVRSIITSSAVSSISAFKVIIATVIVLYAVYDVVLGVVGGLLLKKGVNVD